MTLLHKLGKISGFLSEQLKQNKGSYLSFFLLGLTLRGIPELLIAQYPVGYETISWYAPIMMRFDQMSLVEVFMETFRWGSLFYALSWLAASVTRAHPFLLLKVIGPFLYGCLAVSFFLFLRHGLNMRWKTAFVGDLILVFQVAALRIAWDRFRNVLGLIFVFATLTALRSEHKFKWWLVAGLAVLTVLSREYIALVLFFAVVGSAFLERKDRVVSLVALTPALGIFVAMVYPARFLWNYVSESQYALGTYLWVVQDVLSIFAVCYLLFLPFVLRGFRRESLLDPMVFLLLLGSFSVVAFPWFVVPGYQRWLMLLVFPLSVYAVVGLERLRLLDKGSFRKLAVILLIFITIGVGYSTGVFSYVGTLPNSYVTVNLVQSSIDWDQIDDVKSVLKWLDGNTLSDSSVLAEERFYGWTLIYLKRANDDIKVIAYGANSQPQTALEKALSDGFQRIYLIWYTNSRLRDFQKIYSQNSISIFQYKL